MPLTRLRLAASGPLCTTFLLVALAIGFCQTALAQQAQAESGSTLFQNVRIFDGTSTTLSAPSHVLVRGNVIQQISTAPIDVDAGVTVIEGGGRTLMPGLIDAHWHTIMAATPMMVMMAADPAYIQLLAARQAEMTLMRGFTTVRDLGGPAFAIKRSIDEGVVVGPRIYASGATISQTAGHGDFRFDHEVPRTSGGPLSYTERVGIAAIADSPDEVRLRAREQLRLGATQLKLASGGGVSSPHGPIESIQFTEQELRAAVEAAENWGTYVTVHAYTPAAIQLAIRAGVKSIDHGHLADEETARMMAENGVWWSLQPFMTEGEFAPITNDAAAQARAQQIFVGMDRAYKLAKRHGIKTAFGSDILFDRRLFNETGTSIQGVLLSALLQWYTPAEALRMATADNGELIAMTGFINPYPGKLGVVEVGALADLLLVDGNPLDDIKLFENPHQNLLVIMKDGQIFKDTRPD